MEWQPIETTPDNNAETVLLWNGVRVFAGWGRRATGWHDYEGGDFHADPQPTHWMPLPTPPPAPTAPEPEASP